MSQRIKVNLKQEAPVKVKTEEVIIVAPGKVESQNKSVKITENGTTEVNADRGYLMQTVKIETDVKPNLQSKNATENGTVAPDEGYDGLSEVVVDVNPALQEKEITSNGEYEADAEFYGLKKVKVNVAPKLQNKTVEITGNGTHTITADEGQEGLGKVEVVVNTPDTLPLLLSNQLTEYANEDISILNVYAFYSSTALKTVHLPSVNVVRERAFAECTGLTSATLGTVGTLGQYAFDGCTSLAELNCSITASSVPSYCFRNTPALNIEIEFPNATTISNYGLQNCGFTKIVMPKLASISSNVCQKSVSLKRFEMAKSTTSSSISIGSNSFNGCSSLDTFVIRKTGKVISLSSTNAFTGTLIESGTGYVYVPDALVEDYKAATNWSTFANQIKPLSELPTE